MIIRSTSGISFLSLLVHNLLLFTGIKTEKKRKKREKRRQLSRGFYRLAVPAKLTIFHKHNGAATQRFRKSYSRDISYAQLRNQMACALTRVSLMSKSRAQNHRNSQHFSDILRFFLPFSKFTLDFQFAFKSHNYTRS